MCIFRRPIATNSRNPAASEMGGFRAVRPVDMGVRLGRVGAIRAARASVRLAIAASVACYLALIGPARAQDDVGPVVMVRPTQLDLGVGPQPVELWVEGATAMEGFALNLAFDPELVVITATEPGDFLSSSGGAAILKPRLPDPGVLELSATIVLGDGQVYPSGGGVMATVTLAPLVVGDASPITLSNVVLHGADGDMPVQRTVDGSVVVSLEPPEAVVTAAVAQATAMAESLGGAGTLVPSMPDVSRYGSEIVWFGLLVLSVAVVVVGWLIGRRPPATVEDRRWRSGGPSYGP